MKNDEKILRKRVDVVRVELVKEKSILFQGRYVKTPEQAVELVRNHFNIEWSDRECFLVVGLNVKSMPTHMNMVAQGNVISCGVSIRELMKVLILSNSTSFVCFHNHPSSDTTPSKEDVAITQRIVDAGKLMGINMVDHIILGQGCYCSLKEEGYL